MKNRILDVLCVLSLAFALLFLGYRHKPGAPLFPPAVTERATSPEHLEPAKQLDTSDMPSLGNPKAPVVIVEFSDYECPFCKRHAGTVYPEIRDRFVNEGMVRYVFANNPLNMHQNAKALAYFALCAQTQGRYFQVHDLLFRLDAFDPTKYEALSREAGIDGKKQQACLANPSPWNARIDRDVKEAAKLGLAGTPGFAIGKAESGGRIAVNWLVQGARSIQVFSELFEKELSAAMTTKPANLASVSR